MKREAINLRSLRPASCILGIISVFLTWLKAPLAPGLGNLYYSLVDYAGLEYKLSRFTGYSFDFSFATTTLIIFGVGCILVYFTEWGSLLMAGGVGYYYFMFISKYGNLQIESGLALAIFAVGVGILGLLLLLKQILKTVSCILGAISVFLPWLIDPSIRNIIITPILIFTRGISSASHSLIDLGSIELSHPYGSELSFSATNVYAGTITLALFVIGCLVIYFSEWGSLLMSGGIVYYYTIVSTAYIVPTTINNLQSTVGLALAIFASGVGILSLLLKHRPFRTKTKIHYASELWR